MELSENFYNVNAEKFSDTRFCLWDCVKDFGEKFTKNDLICDAGCGNGKNIKYFDNKFNIYGFDKCEKLVNICIDKGYNVCQSDILNIPYSSNHFDYVMCIAVIHHLDSIDIQIKAINELMRILKKNGELLFTLWAFESDEYSKKKNFKKGHNFINFDKSYRYYYIYDELMLKDLLKNINYKSNYYWERGNWNIILQK